MSYLPPEIHRNIQKFSDNVDYHEMTGSEYIIIFNTHPSGLTIAKVFDKPSSFKKKVLRTLGENNDDVRFAKSSVFNKPVYLLYTDTDFLWRDLNNVVFKILIDF